MKEEAVTFGAGDCLLGVITDGALTGGARANLVGDDSVPIAAAPVTRPAFVFLDSGSAHQVGPNHLYVKLARSLAEQGFSSIRFDDSGLGDGGRDEDGMPDVRSAGLQARAAMDLLARTRGIHSFILIGIHAGALNAFVAAQADTRVTGTVLINARMHLHGLDPQLGDQLHERAMARHSWRIALKSSFRSKNWKRVLDGQLKPGQVFSSMVGGPVRAVAGRVRSLGGGTAAVDTTSAAVGSGDVDKAPDALAMLQALGERGVHVYHLYGEADVGLDYFQAVLGRRFARLGTVAGSRLEVIPGADHGFTMLWSQDDLVGRVCSWARELPQAPAPVTVGA